MARGTPAKDLQGNTKWFGTCTDIDAVKTTTGALLDAQERLQVIVGSTPVVLWSVDATGVFTLSEGKGLAGLNLEPGAVVGKNIFEIYADNAMLVDAVRRCLAGELVVNETHVGNVWYENSYTPLHGDGGSIIGVVGVAVDITSRKVSAEAQAQARALELLVAVQQQIATSSLESAELMALVAERALDLTDADGAAIVIGDGSNLVVQAVAGRTELTQGFQVPLQDSLNGRCMQENCAIMSNDGLNDARINAFALRRLVLGSVICAPLRNRSGPIGTVSAWCHGTHQFNADKLRAMELIVSLLGAALEQVAALKSRDAAIASLQDVEQSHLLIVPASNASLCATTTPSINLLLLKYCTTSGIRATSRPMVSRPSI